MTFGGLTLVLGVFLGTAEAAPAAALPQDARLEPVRAHLEAIIAHASEAGLPADIVVSKVREGLAKGVPADRIEAAVVRLAENLDVARKFVSERRQGSAPALVRALAEARGAGVDLAETDGLVRGDRPAAEAGRAVEVLTDLTLRGYPAGRTSAVVKDVLARDPAALGRVPAALETLRTEQALTHAESVDALARGLAGSDSLQAGYTRALDDERRKGDGRGKQKGGDHDSGKNGFVPPGQLKKENGKSNPGRGRGKD